MQPDYNEELHEEDVYCTNEVPTKIINQDYITSQHLKFHHDRDSED